MYNAKFVSSNGKTFNFGYESGNIFDISGLTGFNVAIATSQGFSQIGETVENQSVGSQIFNITGKLFKNVVELKNKMLSTFVPFTSGRLYFNERFFIDCFVQKTPTIQIGNKIPKFTLQLFAPYPFWQSVSKNSFVFGGYTPAFSFPVNYAQPHKFGIKSDSMFLNCYNGGTVEANYTLKIRTSTYLKNPSIINAQSQEFLALQGEINAGEELTVYKVENRLRVELLVNGVIVDVFSWLDEDSTLFSIHVGDNIIRATAEEGEENMIASISFNDTVVSVYEEL